MAATATANDVATMANGLPQVSVKTISTKHEGQSPSQENSTRSMKALSAATREGVCDVLAVPQAIQRQVTTKDGIAPRIGLTTYLEEGFVVKLAVSPTTRRLPADGDDEARPTPAHVTVSDVD